MSAIQSRRIAVAYLALCLAVQPLLTAAAEPPGPDVTPPEIIHAPLAEFAPGMPRRIQATVTDNVGVAEVVLLYRTSGDPEYQRLRMMQTPGTDIYWAELPDTVGPRVEYVIQASDVSGNRVLGQLFDPYVTTVRPEPTTAGAPALASSANSRAAAPSRQGGEGWFTGSGSHWLWIGLGVVAVAALAGVAASHGGSGGSGGTDNSAGSGSNGNGTVTIKAPVP